MGTEYMVEWLSKHERLHSPAKPILGFLPALLAIFFVVAFVKDIRKLDEMVRRIHLQAAAIAFLLAVILEFIFDGLESAGNLPRYPERPQPSPRVDWGGRACIFEPEVPMKDSAQVLDHIKKQECTVQSLYLSGVMFVIIYPLGLAYFAFEANWPVFAAWLIFLPCLKWTYLRFFPRIAKWKGYGSVEDKLPANVKKARVEVTYLLASGLSVLPNRETALGNNAKGDGFHTHDNRPHAQPPNGCQQRNSVCSRCGSGQGTSDRECHDAAISSIDCWRASIGAI